MSGPLPLPERVFVVTGATDGIGRFTAEQLAGTGATVAVHGRNPAKVTAVVQELTKLSGNPKIKGFVADLSSMADVRRLGTELSQTYPVIDGLLNNAGTFDGDYTGSRIMTTEGNEYTLAVNVLAPFLLTSLLWENVQRSLAARVILTSSISQGSAHKLSDIQCAKGWDSHTAYELSKLCDAMVVMELHDRYSDPPRITFNTMDPGTVDTKMLRAGWSGGSSVRTATDSFWMLTNEALQQVSGKYYVSQRNSRGDPKLQDKAARQKLWDELVRLTGATYPPPQNAL
jgi:NAD(P)-dependent dehydrogenase (short-subunit alcohol dehydrogenase family)